MHTIYFGLSSISSYKLIFFHIDFRVNLDIFLDECTDGICQKTYQTIVLRQKPSCVYPVQPYIHVSVFYDKSFTNQYINVDLVIIM